MDLAIETDNQETLAELAKAHQRDALTSESRGIDGERIFTLVITLTPAIIASVTAVIRAQIAAKRHVRVKCKGTVIEGVSEETLLRLLKDERQ